jgi:hypothetical protein
LFTFWQRKEQQIVEIVEVKNKKARYEEALNVPPSDYIAALRHLAVQRR